MQMMNEATTDNRRISHVEKWLTLGLMERVEQVRTIAMMLETTMEDITDHLDEVQSAVEGLTDETQAIDERIEELMYMIEAQIDDSTASVQQPESVYVSGNEGLPL